MRPCTRLACQPCRADIVPTAQSFRPGSALAASFVHTRSHARNRGSSTWQQHTQPLWGRACFVLVFSAAQGQAGSKVPARASAGQGVLLRAAGVIQPCSACGCMQMPLPIVPERMVCAGVLKHVLQAMAGESSYCELLAYSPALHGFHSRLRLNGAAEEVSGAALARPARETSCSVARRGGLATGARFTGGS